MPSAVVVRSTPGAYSNGNGKQRAALAETNSSLETGEQLRRWRVRIDAAQRDIAEAATITHTTLGDIENGCAPEASLRHVPRIKVALARVAFQRMKLALDTLEEMFG